MIGVYSITNKITGNVYIGSSIDVVRRWMEHKTPKANGNDRLHSDMKKYGLENFSFEVIEECDMSELRQRELDYIRKMQPYYNFIGVRKTEEMKQKVSNGVAKWWKDLPETTRHKIITQNLTGPKKGHTVSAETRAKISKKVSEIQKQKVKCLETGEVFESIGDFEKAYAYPGACAAYWRGVIKSVKGFHVEKCRD